LRDLQKRRRGMREGCLSSPARACSAWSERPAFPQREHCRRSRSFACGRLPFVPRGRVRLGHGHARIHAEGGVTSRDRRRPTPRHRIARLRVTVAGLQRDAPAGYGRGWRRCLPSARYGGQVALCRRQQDSPMNRPTPVAFRYSFRPTLLVRCVGRAAGPAARSGARPALDRAPQVRSTTPRETGTVQRVPRPRRRPVSALDASRVSSA
jgi:hypothetical protein